MQFKLNYLAIAAVVAFAGTASAQDLVVKIGHVAPTSDNITHHRHQAAGLFREPCPIRFDCFRERRDRS